MHPDSTDNLFFFWAVTFLFVINVNILRKHSDVVEERNVFCCIVLSGSRCVLDTVWILRIRLEHMCVWVQIKHKDRKCGVCEGRDVSYIVYGKGLTHKHIILWLRPVTLTFFLKERGKAAFNLNCSLLSTLWKCICWVHGSTVIISNVLKGWELKIKKEVEENVMHDALPHHSEARRMWLIKMFSFKTQWLSTFPL